MIHDVIAQIDAAVPGGWNTVLFGYGPLGGFCFWLTKLVDRLRTELKERDQLIREITDKHVQALRDATHQITGLSRALVYNAATHGEGAVKKMAQREVDKWDKENARL